MPPLIPPVDLNASVCAFSLPCPLATRQQKAALFILNHYSAAAGWAIEKCIPAQNTHTLWLNNEANISISWALNNLSRLHLSLRKRWPCTHRDSYYTKGKRERKRIKCAEQFSTSLIIFIAARHLALCCCIIICPVHHIIIIYYATDYGQHSRGVRNCFMICSIQNLITQKRISLAPADAEFLFRRR